MSEVAPPPQSTSRPPPGRQGAASRVLWQGAAASQKKTVIVYVQRRGVGGGVSDLGNFLNFTNFFSAPLSEFFATGGVPPTPPLSPQLIVGQKDFRNGGWDTPKIHNFFWAKNIRKGGRVPLCRKMLKSNI